MSVSAGLAAFTRGHGLFLAAVLAVSTLVVHIADAPDPRREFVVEMRSQSAGVAQVFYDFGSGMSEQDSSTSAVTASNEFVLLRFALPAGTIHGLRFDPLNGPGTFAIHGAQIVDANGRLIRQFTPGDLVPFNQIEARVIGPADASFTTTPDAYDPILLVNLREPVRPPGVTPTRLARQMTIGLLVTLAVAGAGLIAAARGVTLSHAGRVAGEAIRGRTVARLVLGYALALVVFVPTLAGSLGYALTITLATDAAGPVDVFYDIGNGLSPRDSSTVELLSGRHEYRLPIPPGAFRAIRIDPGRGPGRYTIERVAILGAGGSTRHVVALDEIAVAHQLSVIEQSRARLVVESPAGSDDPQLLYVPAPAIRLLPERTWPRLLAVLIALWTAAVLGVIVLEIVLGPFARACSRWWLTAARWSGAHPRLAVTVAAALGTLVATYPVLFMNRSLVSPNNGGTAMLYDRPPYLPGSNDLVIEDVRGSDVGATMWLFLEYARMQRAALGNGELPMWNRFNSAGLPLWAQGQTFLLDPLHWLALAGGDLTLDLKFVAHRFVFAAGVGFAGLSAGGWLPAAVAAAAAPFLGFYTYRLNHPAAFALTYGAWILVAWLALSVATTRSQLARAALLLAVASALVLFAAPPKEAFVVVVSCQAAGVLLLACSSGRSRNTWRRLAAAALAGIAMVLVTAPQWLMFLDNLRRSMTVYDEPRALVGDPAAMPLLVLGPFIPLPLPALQVTAALLLLATAMAPLGVVRRPIVLACLAVAAGLLAMAFGAVPVAWLVRVPLVANIFHLHITFTSVAILLLSVVHAYGVEVLVTSSFRRACVLSAAAGSLAILLTWCASRWMARPYDLWLMGLLLAGLAAVPLVLQAARQAPADPLRGAAAVSVVALSLLAGGMQLETGVPAMDRLLSQPRPRVDFDATSPAVEAIRGAMTEPARTVGLGTLLLPGSSPLFGLEGIGGPDSLLIGDYQDLLDAGAIERPWGPLKDFGWLIQVSPPNVDRVAPLLDMINVGFVLAAPGSTPSGLVELPMSGADYIRPLRRPTAWPRAFFVDGVARYAAPRDLLTLAAAHHGPLAAIQSTDAEALAATSGLPTVSRPAVAASGYALTTNTTSFVVNAPGPGVAVLAESFLPGEFLATIDGRQVPYFRVNHAFKAVAVPGAGEWHVSFEYRPRRWPLALTLAGMGLLLAAALGWSARQPRGVGASEIEDDATQAHVEPPHARA
jgi:hypothetical protein